MSFLSEDPTQLVVTLGLVAGAFLTALRVTQQGKYLVWTLATLGLAVAVLVVEQLWVTDNERIERVVYDLRRSVLASDAGAALEHMTDDVEFVQAGRVLSGAATRELIRGNLANTSFDFIHINELEIGAGRHTRRGRADFHVYAKGALKLPLGTYNVGTANSTWSLGFQEIAPGVWKVNRITAVSAPEGSVSMPTSPVRETTRIRELEGAIPGIDPPPKSSRFLRSPRFRERLGPPPQEVR